MEMQSKDRIIVAVDTDDLVLATETVDELRPHVGAFKLGLEFWMSLVARLGRGDRDQAHRDLDQYRALLDAIGASLMTDVKYKDIPHTMAGAARGASALGSSLFTVHAPVGVPGMTAAVANAGSSRVLAVTVLTSMGSDECKLSYGTRDVSLAVRRFARMARRAGVHGIVCAPSDVENVRSSLRWEPEFVCPGIRPTWAEIGDQNKDRAMTPVEAIRAGVTRMVIGRPVTKPPARFASRTDAAHAIAEEIALALS